MLLGLVSLLPSTAPNTLATSMALLLNALLQVLQQFSENLYYMEYLGHSAVGLTPYLPDVLCLCEVTKNDGKANEAILERYMIVLDD